jgi:uncharacterized membrane protein (UPF0127 family)
MKTITLIISLGAWLTAGCNNSKASPPVNETVLPAPAPAAAAEKPEAPPPGRCLVPTDEAPPPQAGKADTCPTDPVFGGLEMERARAIFPDAPGKPTVVLELAKNGKERARGLMYRTHLAEDSGMLFVMDGEPRVQSFWMRNTCIPLDMMFIGEDGFIAGILENVPTVNDDRRSIPCPVSYVLEVNAGWARAHGVKAGQRVALPVEKSAASAE